MSHVAPKRNSTKRFKRCFPFHAFSIFVQPIVKDDDETHQKRCLALIHKKKNGRNSLPTVFTPFLPHMFFWGYFRTPQPTGPGSRSLRQLAGSLEMANLAVRHVDTELAEATKHAYQQAKTEKLGEDIPPRCSGLERP